MRYLLAIVVLLALSCAPQLTQEELADKYGDEAGESIFDDDDEEDKDNGEKDN